MDLHRDSDAPKVAVVFKPRLDQIQLTLMLTSATGVAFAYFILGHIEIFKAGLGDVVVAKIAMKDSVRLGQRLRKFFRTKRPKAEALLDHVRRFRAAAQ